MGSIEYLSNFHFASIIFVARPLRRAFSRNSPFRVSFRKQPNSLKTFYDACQVFFFSCLPLLPLDFPHFRDCLRWILHFTSEAKGGCSGERWISSGESQRVTPPGASGLELCWPSDSSHYTGHCPSTSQRESSTTLPPMHVTLGDDCAPACVASDSRPLPTRFAATR